MKLIVLVQKGIFPVSVFVLMIWLMGCEESQPPSVWNPVAPTSGSTASFDHSNPITPANGAWTGFTQVVLHGSNFVDSSRMSVYFGANEWTIKTSTTDSVVLNPPADITKTSSVIRIVRNDAYAVDSVVLPSPYKLFAGMLDVAQILVSTDQVICYATDVDATENIYEDVSTSNLYIIPSGTRASAPVISTPNNVLGSAPTCIRLNKDGYLYRASKGIVPGSGVPWIARTNLGAGIGATYDTVYAKMRGQDKGKGAFDFGPDGKTIYVGGSPNSSGTNLNIIDPELTSLSLRKVIATPFYGTVPAPMEIQAVRVFNGYVYVAVQSQKKDGSQGDLYIAQTDPNAGIWRNKISGTSLDTLDAPELYYDWNAGPISNASIYDITFDVDGNLYIATNNSNPILKVHGKNDSSPEFLYPGLLDSPVLNINWLSAVGGSPYSYIYLNYFKSDARRVGRVVMDKNLYDPLHPIPIEGAPYYGRGY